MLRRTLIRISAALTAAILVLPAGPVLSGDAGSITPGVIYAVGEKFDGSFNEGAYNALTAFREETGTDFLEVSPANPTEFPQAVDRLTRRGVDTIIVVGFYYAEPLSEAAATHPDVDFTIIDSVADAPNVRSILFREHEGAFLTGIMAAMHSETGAIGFVGALDIPLIRKFITGFEEGARYIDPDIEYFVNFVGNTPAAFNDPSTGSELTLSQIDRGADVVFAGAGNSNRGVFQAAADRGAFAIGVDSNQNHEQPGTILTSMLKRVDNAVLDSLHDSLDGIWEPGALSLGIAEGGVGVALDDNNWPLVTPEMMLAVQDAMVAIATGALDVTDASLE
ncbi:BMP family ABC transporter substrate-binding protein [Fodinicurvata sp. EGI_FJ10296]|uniref:BMP family lipoprotein n=1 Tax=Fodinicurvata sp. EGI_FJ10296 TaxID=3231908 RepID=UPI00345524E1